MPYEAVQDSLRDPPPKHARLMLVTSHAITKLGSKAWEFATPLLLLQFDQSSLLAPVAFGLITEGAQPIFGPFIGDLADRAPSRLKVVFWGCLIQVIVLILNE